MSSRFELKLERLIQFKALFEILFGSRIFAAHQPNNASIAISFGKLRLDLDRPIEIGHGAIKITSLGQHIAAVIVETRMLFESNSFTYIGDGLINPAAPIKCDAPEVKTKLQLLPPQLNRF